jgi:hypothetical protein
MHNIVQIEGNNGLIRDMSSHAILNTSSEQIDSYNSRKKVAQLRELELSKQKEEINSLKEDVKEIKAMLEALLKR